MTKQAEKRGAFFSVVNGVALDNAVKYCHVFRVRDY
jgi:hypothetical protein